MIAAIKIDLQTIAARLVEVFELAEFTATDAKDVAGERDLTRLVSAGLLCQQAGLFGGWSYTNAIPRNSDLAPA